MTPGLSSDWFAFNARQFMQMRHACFAFLGIAIFTLHSYGQAASVAISRIDAILSDV